MPRSKVIKKLKKLKKKRKNSKFYILTRIEDYMNSFEYECALKWCHRGISKYPKSEIMLETCGNVMLENGQTDNGIKAVKLAPDTGHVKYLQLGQLTSGDEAKEYFTKGIEIMSTNGTSEEEISLAYCSLAELYLTDKCFEENADECCYKYCNKALEYNPNNPEAYQLLGSYYLSKCDIKKAKSSLMKGVDIWLPQLKNGDISINDKVEIPPYFARINLSKLLIEINEYETAYDVLESLLKDDDEVLSVWYLMGWLEFLRENYDESQVYLEKVIDLYVKLKCDDEEMLIHSKEILQKIKLKE